MSVEVLREHVLNYLEGRISLDELDDWLVETTPLAAESNNLLFRRMHNSAQLQLGEFDHGFVSETEFVDGLQALLLDTSTHNWNRLTTATIGALGRILVAALPRRSEPALNLHHTEAPAGLTYSARQWGEALARI